MSSHSGGVRELSGVCFIRALIPLLRAQPSWANRQPQGPPPNTITLGIKFQHQHLGGHKRCVSSIGNMGRTQHYEVGWFDSNLAPKHRCQRWQPLGADRSLHVSAHLTQDCSVVCLSSFLLLLLVSSSDWHHRCSSKPFMVPCRVKIRMRADAWSALTICQTHVGASRVWVL